MVEAFQRAGVHAWSVDLTPLLDVDGNTCSFELAGEKASAVELAAGAGAGVDAHVLLEELYLGHLRVVDRLPERGRALLEQGVDEGRRHHEDNHQKDE